MFLAGTFAFAFACQSPPSKSDPAATAAEPGPGGSGSASPAADPVCAAEPLQAELGSYCEFDLGVPAIELPKVTWTADSYHPLATRVITLDENGLTDPEGQGTVSIQAWLADPPRRIPEPGEMTLAIAADLPASTVAELWRGLAAVGRTEVRVLVHVADDRPIPQPRNPDMLADMRAELPPDPNDRVVFVAKGVRGYANNCPPLASIFGELGNVAPGDRCTKLAELASAAVVECGCVKLPDIMTLLYALTIGFTPPTGRAAAVPIRLDPGSKVAPPLTTTWAEVVTANLRNDGLHQLWIDAVAPPAYGYKPPSE
ncbi:hypothetical protein DB30_01826 [Enhygromyxa salina]|uniref:Uncharacterized protein n=1 Tax=Enhygromyxa salina TaxID=215803 RepID=A0A0C2CR76_9BACT|nr:hypothetical protein DB30_01826 [Enhygromyxa salina]